MRFYGDSYVDINLRNPVQSRQERRINPSRILSLGEAAATPVVPRRLIAPADMPIVSTKSRRVIRSVAIWFTFLGIDAG